MLGHLQHRHVRHAVLLEHGCEHTHNDTVRQYLEHRGVDAGRFGYASVQLDGGLASVRGRVADLFADLAARAGSRGERQPAGAGDLSIALSATGEIDETTAQRLAALTGALAAAGGTVVIPENAALLGSRAFRETVLLEPDAVRPTLGYGDLAEHPGLHVMETPTENQTETLTGLGATGVSLMVFHVGRLPLQAHPMLPLVQVSAHPDVLRRYRADLDLELGAEDDEARLADLIGQVASGEYAPKLFSRGVAEFQLTRGLLGLSM
jgi:hypothetical protein